ncbi:MAG: 4-hydroxy-3-methylbut-2-enyl diphosphate reductase [Lachnospiraceae bacterium]|nr:4-hydroxy-3-methylbut-2-enyl diphosphate reductase [Lachnospiraceae bacterium]MCQ2525796.1 4-hydroxy-3-methylbut-2-enyl diphosphate reductase [Lachnospiraceae bacterium]
MEVKLAKYAGFCFGVKRAVDTVYERVDSGRRIYTYGPIVHNEEVVKDMEAQGVSVIKNEEALDDFNPEPDSLVVIRAHGVTKREYDKLTAKGFEIIDATCPFVKKIHNIAIEQETLGRQVLIAGDPEHPEIKGIVGWCNGPVKVFRNYEDAEKFVPEKGINYVLLAQTTFQVKKFKEIVDLFANKEYNIYVVNTICNATEERQRSAAELSQEADAMIVIGSNGSSNTRKLYEICRERCENTYYIQTLDDLHLVLPNTTKLVGITAGASTPQNIIEEVQNNVRGTYF